ncbi:MAG: FKBP-type peptidyl-prolyl cis-trans isomerase [Lepagella sp.]
MKKSIFIASALVLMGMAACSSSKSESNDSDTTLVAVEDEIVVEEDSLTRIFKDETKMSETATDSTWAVTESGLKYIVVKEGTGKSPKATDEVTVHYCGQLTTGYVFDSSYDRGEPASFPLNQVIAGWTEGLQLMKEGGKTIFYIPSKLGYGERGAGEQIPPFSDLIFTVELIKVNE